MRTPITWVEKVTGFFVMLVALLVVVLLLVTARRQDIFGTEKDLLLHAHLASGSGLKKGCPVVIADAEIGVVEDVSLLELPPIDVPEHRVKATFRVEASQAKHVRRGTRGVVDRPLLGGARLELVTPTITAAMLRDPGLMPPPLESDSRIEAEAPDTLQDTVKRLEEDLDAIKVAVQGAAGGVERAAGNVGIIAGRIATGEGPGGQIIVNAEKASAGLPEIVASLKRTLADLEVAMRNIREASGDFPEVARKADRALGETAQTIEGVQDLPFLRSRIPREPAIDSEYDALPRGGPR